MGDDGFFKALKKALVERALNAELADHLDYETHDASLATAVTGTELSASQARMVT